MSLAKRTFYHHILVFVVLNNAREAFHYMCCEADFVCFGFMSVGLGTLMQFSGLTFTI